MKYTNNEAYFDVIEEIDAIIDKQGNTVIAEVQGYVSSHSNIHTKVNSVTINGGKSENIQTNQL